MILILFFDSKGVIHHKYVPESQIVNATFYVQVLDCLCKRISHVRPEVWRNRKFFLLLDNACLHTAAIVQQFLSKKGVAQLSHTPYLPVLRPPLYFAFPKLKLELKGDHYASIEDIQKSVTLNFWLYASCEMARRSRLRVYLSVRRLFRINITFANFLHFPRFCSVVAKLIGHTLYLKETNFFKIFVIFFR